MRFNGLVLGLVAGMMAATPAAAVLYLKTATQTENYSVAFTSETQYNNNPPTSQITSFQPLSFTISQFNPIGSKGQALQLTDVKISITSQLGGSINLSGSANPRVGNLAYSIGNSFTIDLPGPSDFVVTTTPGQGASIPFVIPSLSQVTLGFGSTNTSSSGNFTPSTFVPYVGTGNFTVTHALANLLSDITLTTGGRGNLRGEANANVNGTFVIQYSYLDPVPEPASWAMLITGFGLIGATARRRRVIA
ncbi:hypothetical protein CHU93_08960 [Sandarakinorhabdus cyanobacteriorum]|uniref:Ice-binding protein C-terminal domain-containing protein n=1 Tax=Sandarakinorhabdus cyanobacteriorum TaxID=1981098 RepID=A0A255YHK2_9SPHN|nr:PEPxxWA-CTERM sorting domain-containing protein [Sandarakinorhabdus cyanobacteriorum]OYQ28679.1 hypothetical protein CHU93_08960 [Sandarakinorhabdus cyanobacteriorum]